MRFERVVLHEVAMPLREPFHTSFGSIDRRRFLIVEGCVGGQAGWGEATVLGPPLYSEETAGTAWHVLESFLIPRAFACEWERPEELAAALRPIRGHRMARAALEGAAWDAFARLGGIPLARAIGGARERVAAGVAIGLQPDMQTLVRRVGECLAEGYQRIKVKIKPGWDFTPLRALRDHFGDLPLMADANSAYTLADSEALRRLDQLGLLMIEQPLAEDDIVDHARLQAALTTPICLDESIRSADDARKALELGSCRIINVKVGRVGGLTESRRVHDLCRERGVPLWCGGMLESGVGRAHNIALASLPGFTLPGDLSPSARYWARDLIEPEVTLSTGGAIAVPSAPGIGFTVRRDALEQFTLRRQVFLPSIG